MLRQIATLWSRSRPWGAGTRTASSLHVCIYVGACRLFITLSRGITVVKIVLRSTLQKIHRRLAVQRVSRAYPRAFGRRAPFVVSFLPSWPCLGRTPPNFAIVINDNDSGTSFYHSRGITFEMQNAPIPRCYLKRASLFFFFRRLVLPALLRARVRSQFYVAKISTSRHVFRVS